MTDHEEAFNRWKEETRREALEKELTRLQKEDSKKSRMLKKMRNAVIILSTLLLLSFAYILVWNTSSAKHEANVKQEQETDQNSVQPGSKKGDSIKVKKDSIIITQLNLVLPGSDTIRFNIPDDGIFFSVQVGAYTGIDMSKFKNSMVSLHQVEYGGLNQFTLGILPTYEEAEEFRDIVKTIGFEQAYITAIKNGKRINIHEAIQQRQK
jgi:hypothetical protein